MNSYILCSPQHAFLGVIGLLVCGLFSTQALEAASRGAESLAGSHPLSASVDGRAARTALASADVPHYYR